jgi:hypothetical protein
MLDDDKPSAADIAGEESVNVANHADHLVRLHINQSSISQAWTKFMIVIQGSLATALGYILLLKEQPATPIRITLYLIIAVFGMATSVVIRIIIKRHHQWAAWFVQQYGLLPGNLGVVYPASEKPFVATKISELDPGHVGKTLIVFCNALTFVWFVAAIVVIFWAVP